VLMNFWRSIRISNGKIFSRRYDMPRGGPRNVRSCWPTREASRRYEPVPALGRSAECGGSACGSLVRYWPDGRARCRNHGLRRQIRLRRIDARLGFQRHAGGNPGNEGTKPSVVQIRSDNLSPAVIGDPLIAALQQMAPELAAGALLTVDPGRTRLHLLPLRSNKP
jgi:hypothetical protein